eukprot:scaffold10582_cov60-Attheya_sp.AAC.1
MEESNPESDINFRQNKSACASRVPNERPNERPNGNDKRRYGKVVVFHHSKVGELIVAVILSTTPLNWTATGRE